MEVLIGVVVALATIWGLFVLVLLFRRPRNVSIDEVVRILPDVLRLLRDLAVSPTSPRSVRIVLWFLLAYLLFPLDVVPDFLPGLGYLDDVVVVALALRFALRRSGSAFLRRTWRGTAAGLEVVLRLAGVGAPRGPAGPPNNDSGTIG